MGKQRLDQALVTRNLSPSRAKAQAVIDAGQVRVSGLIAPKASSLIDENQHIELILPEEQWVTRGGFKLAGALEDLHIDPTGLVALDAGCAHGGFTDVLLTRGAKRVIAVDVAYGQFDWGLRSDPRVHLMERTNIRHLQAGDLPEQVDLVVADLSFISLTKVLDGLLAACSAQATLLPMVKPQFEIGKGRVGKGGVVRDPADWAEALDTVIRAAQAKGCALKAIAPSRTPGPSGNIEYFVQFIRGSAPNTDPTPLIQSAIATALTLVPTHAD